MDEMESSARLSPLLSPLIMSFTLSSLVRSDFWRRYLHNAVSCNHDSVLSTYLCQKRCLPATAPGKYIVRAYYCFGLILGVGPANGGPPESVHVQIET